MTADSLLLGIMQAADKALDSLKRMRAGMAADRKVGRAKMKREMATLFHPGKKRKCDKRSEWHHKFSLAYRDQERIPTTDVEKEDKEVHFENLDIG